jgi:hypothetical protein
MSKKLQHCVFTLQQCIYPFMSILDQSCNISDKAQMYYETLVHFGYTTAVMQKVSWLTIYSAAHFCQAQYIDQYNVEYTNVVTQSHNLPSM